MNPSAPIPNHYPFPCPPQNPNPNPNFFFHSFPYHQQPPPQPPPPPPPPPLQPPNLPPPTSTTTTTSDQSSDLSTTLSSLTHLLILSQQTLTSSSLFSTLPKPQKNPNHVLPCPHNPHHLVSPESLFLHSLHCPSPRSQHPTTSLLLASLHYPKTLSLQNPPPQILSSQSISHDPTTITDLCLPLDCYYSEFGSNFFYKDCPGVVNFNNLDSLKRVFTLPRFLLTECADFVDSNRREVNDFDRNGFKVLPSDLWAIRKEVDGWADFPSEYSYSVFCAILQLNLINLSDLKRWVIVGSPYYGVIIDVYMRDHISILFRLGLKAIRREALGLAVCYLEAKSSGFNCPVLVQVLAWIVSQLSVLYGEGNAKSFAAQIFRQCVLEVTNEVLLFALEYNLKDSSRDLESHGTDITDVDLKDPLEGGAECKASEGVNTSVDMVFVSQVAGAVAALHERSLLEAKLKALRVSQSLPRYQRLAEHSYVSQRADEERKNCPNYRAIVEHDGLLRKQSSEQATSMNKTREELLAEERDYKRRRMSYRGKKLKRSTLQVTRDIIDEYMEEIKQAGGIGCFEKGAEEEGLPPEFCAGPKFPLGDDELMKSNSDYSKDIRSASTIDSEGEGRSQHGHREHLEYRRSTSQDRHGRDSKYGSPERRRHEQRSDRGNYRRERDESSRRNHHEKRTSSKSSYHDYESSKPVSYSTHKDRTQEDYKKSDSRNRHHRTSYGKYASNVLTENAFEDRYHPTESHDIHEEDVDTGYEYVKREGYVSKSWNTKEDQICAESIGTFSGSAFFKSCPHGKEFIEMKKFSGEVKCFVVISH